MQDDKTKRKKEFKRRIYDFTLKLINFIDKLPHDNISKRLGDQLLRSGTSVIANYIEGQAASSRKDFTNFLNISLKSCNESKLWLSLLKDSGKASEKDTKFLLDELIEFSNIFASSILTLRNRK